MNVHFEIDKMIIRKKPIVLNKLLVVILILSILVILSHINFISSQGETSYCCEKLKNKAWCQNAPLDKCDDNYRSVPTSCEATSYCRLGTCYNSNEGTCMENTPQKVCQDSGGIWSEGEPDEIPQCQLGCCLIGEQAAFVTQTRCKALSGLYGLETNYRTDIQSEVECIASATAGVKGACVIDNGFERTCKFTTQKECRELQGTTSSQGTNESGGFSGLFGGNKEETKIGESTTEFHEGFLCSADELGTNCGPSTKTTCVEGRDEVYYLDSCGNLANIYDASKFNDKNYWKEIKSKVESCVLSDGNKKSCGNCDYYAGTTCKAASRGDSPVYGEHICKNLGCEDEDFYELYNRQPNHGETWCATSKGTSSIIFGEDKIPSSAKENLPGGRYFRKVCYNNEVTIEPCADFRNEVCIQSEVGTFKTSACKVNMWQDCTAQDNKEDCENEEKRDCKWITSAERDEDDEEIFVCAPKYAPGFDFWQEGTDAESLCSLANSQCVVKSEKGLGGSWKVKENEHCLKDGDAGWEGGKIALCQSLGDCGWKINYIGEEGENEQYDGFTGKSYEKESGKTGRRLSNG